MTLKKLGWSAAMGFACVAMACASEDDSTIGTGGSGNFGGFGTGGTGTGGFSTGGFSTGGTGAISTGGTGNVGTGGTATGGTGNVGTGGAATGGTGAVGTGGTATGGASGSGGAGTGGFGTGGFGTGGFGTGGSSGGGTCVGNCGLGDPSGSCFCDSSCLSLGDCCSDYLTVCGGSGGSGGGGTGGSGGSTGGSGGVATGGTGGVATGGTGGVATGGTGGVATGGTGGTGGVATGGTGGTGGTTGCQNAEECSNPATMICNPKTFQCQAGQCTATSQCPNNEACLGQVPSAAVGACYPQCTPYATGTGCASTHDCVPYLLDGTEGACFQKGTTADGAACADTDVGTGCVAGSICVRDSGVRVCRRQCNFFASSPACVASQRCALGGVCIAEGGDAAALGAACSVASAAGEICGNDGKAWRGTCQDLGSGLRCYKVCRTSVSADCTSSQTCSPFQSDTTAGVCI